MPPSMTTTRDIPILITSTASSSERRITPSWTIAHLKTKLEPVTGVAPSSQILALRLPDRQEETAIEAEDEESVEIGRWPLVAYAEIKVWSFVFIFILGVHSVYKTKTNDCQTSAFTVKKGCRSSGRSVIPCIYHYSILLASASIFPP